MSEQAASLPPIELARRVAARVDRMMAHMATLPPYPGIGVDRADLRAALDGDPEAIARLRRRLED